MSERYRKSEQLLERALRSIPLGTQTFSKSKTQFPRDVSPYYVTRAIRNRDLKHGLCHVHRDTSIVLHDGLLLLPRQQRLWHIDADSVEGGAHLINAADEAGASEEASPLICGCSADLGMIGGDRLPDRSMAQS